VEGDDPPPEAIARELAELRAWRLIEKDRHELRKLRELKRKVQQGDLSAPEEDLDCPQPPPREYGYSNSERWTFWEPSSQISRRNCY